MLIKNITDKFTPKPISVGNTIIMPGESCDVPDEIAYVDVFDRLGNKTGKKTILPSVVLLAGMNQITYEETKKEEETAEEEKTETVSRRGRKKAE